jgi:hypothetical protein
MDRCVSTAPGTAAVPVTCPTEQTPCACAGRSLRPPASHPPPRRSRVRSRYCAHDRRVKGDSGRGIVGVLDMKSTDPIIELRRQARESSGWHSTQRVDLVRSQLNSELETGASGVPKEISPETSVRQQATERSFHVSLTHASPSQQGVGQAPFSLSTTCWCDFARECVHPHLNVELGTPPPKGCRAKTARSVVRAHWRTPCTGALRRTRS